MKLHIQSESAISIHLFKIFLSEGTQPCFHMMYIFSCYISFPIHFLMATYGSWISLGDLIIFFKNPSFNIQQNVTTTVCAPVLCLCRSGEDSLRMPGRSYGPKSPGIKFPLNIFIFIPFTNDFLQRIYLRVWFLLQNKEGKGWRR